MKPSLQHIEIGTKDSSVLSFEVISEHFDFHWHFHPEIEICFIDKGRGTRYVGHNISTFSDGDLVLIGKNTPHTWVAQEKDQHTRVKLTAEVIQFSEDAFVSCAKGFPEFKTILQFLQQAQYGFLFPVESWPIDYGQRIRAIRTTQGLRKVVLLLDVLYSLSTSHYKQLNETAYQVNTNPVTSEKINQTVEFIDKHIPDKITLAQLAGRAHMHPNAFSRFFKKHTGQSLSDFILQKRIDRACNLLITSGHSIHQIAIESGFLNQSHFNRSFKKQMTLTPRAYRDHYS